MNIQATIHEHVLNHGIAIQHVFPTKDDPGPSFTYTIGMTRIGAPELIVFGLPAESIMPVFNQIYAEILKGDRDKQADRIDDLMSVPLLIDAIEEGGASEFVVQADEYFRRHGGKPVYMQVVWPDTQGKFPFEAGFDERFKEFQPYLGSRAEKRLKKLIRDELDGPAFL